MSNSPDAVRGVKESEHKKAGAVGLLLFDILILRVV